MMLYAEHTELMYTYEYQGPLHIAMGMVPTGDQALLCGCCSAL